jgi:hypothetical protein
MNWFATAMNRSNEVIDLKPQGKSIKEIVTQTGITQTSVWRILKAK